MTTPLTSPSSSSQQSSTPPGRRAPAGEAGNPIRVLVTDDSVVVRKLVSQALAVHPGIEVVGTAANGHIALNKVRQLEPDVVTMDIEMPEMDGITAVRELRAAGYRRPIIMCSTLTERGAAATLDALAAGASDYVTKPSNTGSIEKSLQVMTDDLVPKVLALVPRQMPRTPGAATPRLGRRAPSLGLRTVAARKGAAPAVEIVVIGSSTGGPNALSTLIEGLTKRPKVPVVVVQHMPPVFTRQLSERLDRIGSISVVEAHDGQALVAGTVYIAPGGRHLEVRSAAGLGVVRLNDNPPVNYCRPSVDVMFRSAAASYSGGVLGVVLTGMGSDGAQGAGQIAKSGGAVLAQDPSTSVVWGMPGAVTEAGYARAVLPLGEIAAAIERGIEGASI